MTPSTPTPETNREASLKTRGFLSRHGFTLLAAAVLGGYIVISGMTNSCPACRAATDLLSITSSEAGK
jgi:hypothetical protein